MANSTSIRTEEHPSNLRIVKNEPSKGKVIGFALVIILGLGGLVVAGVGLGGYLQAGSLSNLGQVNSMIMTAAGGVSGIIFLIVGIVGSVKNRQTNRHQQNDINEDTGHRNTITSNNSDQLKNTKTNSEPTKKADIIKSVDTQGGLVYRKEAYKIWDADVLDKVPDAPIIPWDAKDPHFNEAYRENYVLLYIPERIRVNNQDKNFDLKALKEISRGPFSLFSERIETQFGDSKAPGWVLVSKKTLPKNSCEDYEDLKKKIEAKEDFRMLRAFRMLHALEAIVLNLMLDAFTKEKVYSSTHNWCIEKVNWNMGQYPVTVGGSDPDGLCVGPCFSRSGYCSAAVALQNF